MNEILTGIAMFTAVILLLVLLFPQGIAGFVKRIFDSRRQARESAQ